MPKIDKSVTIPSFTEVNVELDLNDVLEDFENSDILDWLFQDEGGKSILRRMQLESDFTDGEIKEALGTDFFKDENALPDIETIVTYVHTSMGSANKLKLMKNILSRMED